MSSDSPVRQQCGQGAQEGTGLPGCTAIVGTLVAGGFVAILNQTAMATAVPHIMQTFDLTENTAQWLTTIFMLINGVMIPITAFLIETFTTRQLFFTAMSVFFGGTVMCALAPGFPFLIVGRVVQAAGAGIILPLTMTVIFRVFPPHRRGFAMGTVGLVIAFAPALGPTISGWIVENHSWRTIFIVMLPIALLDIAAAHRYLKNVTYQTYPRVDILSILLSVVGFGGLLYGFSSAGNIGWDHARVVIALGAGALTLLVFILRQLRLPEPILEFRVFQNRTFTIATVITVLAFMAMISAETILPIYMQNMAGFTALQSGQVIMPGALLMGMMSPIAGRIFDRIGARILALTGLTIVTVTTLFFTRLSPDTGLQGITVFFALRMFGVSMVMMPVTTAGLNALRSDLIPHGTAMNNTMRQVGASIGTGTLVTVMTLTALDTGPQAPAAARIHGVNVAFAVTAFLSLAAFALAFFLPGAKQSSAARASSE